MSPSASSPLDPHAALQHLRGRAERHRIVSESLPPDAAPEVQRLVQELQVHQIELEMQYEELLLAQAEAERSRLQYLDLYDFAPVGYCTVAANGTLLQLNLRTSQLLGRERQQLLGRRLALFVAPAARHEFAEFLARLWAAPSQRHSIELAMRGPQEEPFYAQLEGLAAPEGDDESLPPASCRLVLLDVTARRQATDTLAASEARFRATFEQARDGMVLLEGLHVVDLNAAALHLLGVKSKSAALGRPLASFWPEFQPDGRRSLDVLSQCTQRAQVRGWCRLEWMRYSPAGEEVWDEMSFNPVFINGQALLHVAWRDITARRLSEQQLSESESRLQMALAAAGAGVWGWEPATGLLYQDARAQEILGLAPGTEAPIVPFSRLHEALHPADAARVAQALALAEREHALFDLEHRLLRPTGEVRHVAAMGRFSYDEHTGQAERFTGLVRDVTPRRTVEEELGYKNRLLGNLLQNLPLLLARLGPDGRYREHTGRTVRRLGLRENELVGRLAAEVWPESAAHFQRLLSGERDSYVASVVRDGQTVALQCFGFFDEEQQEVVIFAIDITESERLKEETTRLKLRQQQALLSAILSTQEEERRRIAEALHNGVGQLLYATRLHLDALASSEPVRAGQQLLKDAIEATRTISFELTPSILEDFGLQVALQELVSRIPASLAVDLNLHGLAEPLPALLTTAVYRIVQELLNNVMKHAQAHEVFVQVSREDDQLHISVEDDGVGFEADTPGRSGIGLAGIRTRVGLLGGTFTINSRPGRGTGFFLQLPILPG
ncbi:PAS domain S-box protein [Hymenobacter cheonanensis]|uniref:PAS domain S-box protein n=1 Tax=Hymenobacter sp. CA2-7 TaxID=3063993 RepID=UPI002712D2AE|nr:PAS domain S-box protein [Hymenobacter sp. CA2-7]MDO7884895.1 PAS domain S-box protein [Hymenobacter sp. CA2-7]